MRLCRNAQLSGGAPSCRVDVTMRILLSTGVLLLGALTAATAQVTVNPKALESVGGRAHKGASATEHHQHVHHHHASRREHARHHAASETAERQAEGRHNAKAEPRKAEERRQAPAPRSLVKQPPTVPAAPPPVPVLAPLVPPPPKHPEPTRVPVPVVAGAIGEATKLPDGLRITFAAGSADLNPANDAALEQLAHDTAAKPNAIINVLAYAAGSPDDPSTPRRLSLSRALIARAVLLAQGISSTRIYVRALGAEGGNGPPDRVDIIVSNLDGRGKP